MQKQVRESLEIRRDILNKLKKQVALYLGKEPTELRRYALAYKKDIERLRWTASQSSDLKRALKQARIIFGGDFHAYAQAQRVHLRHLRELSKDHRLVLGLECFYSKDQKWLDAFVTGKISEKFFLNKIQWKEKWGFPWAQYRPLVELVREAGGRCVALNLEVVGKKLKLRQRDRHAAQILKKEFLQLHENEKVYVIYGDLHIAQNHLPQDFAKKIKTLKAQQMVTLYLNPEKIYFHLFKKKREHEVSILRFTRNQFCLLESPPWVKWQSYLLFLEGSSDDLLEDNDLDYADHLATLFDILQSDLNLKIERDVSIYSFRNHDFLDLLEIKLTAQEFSLAKKMVSQDMSFYFPQNKMAYLARDTVNYAAHLVGMIVHSHLSQRKRQHFHFPQDLTKSVWTEAVAFFLSKWINPHRKATSMAEVKKQLVAFSNDKNAESAMKIALDQKMKDLLLSYSSRAETNEQKAISHKATDPLLFMKAAKILGSFIGDRMHRFSKTGLLSRAQILTWLKFAIEEPTFEEFYIQILKELDRMDSLESYGQPR